MNSHSLNQRLAESPAQLLLRGLRRMGGVATSLVLLSLVDSLVRLAQGWL